jgi:DNA-binding transcriptional regulator WhiA
MLSYKTKNHIEITKEKIKLTTEIEETQKSTKLRLEYRKQTVHNLNFHFQHKKQPSVLTNIKDQSKIGCFLIFRTMHVVI